MKDLDPYGEEDWNDENEIHEGDKVICIDNIGLIQNFLNLNQVYTVSFIKCGVNLHLKEVPGYGFHVTRFKKI